MKGFTLLEKIYSVREQNSLRGFTPTPESHVREGGDEWLSGSGFRPPKGRRNVENREATDVKPQSFTLVEIMIAAAIAFLLLGAVLAVFFVGDKIWHFDMGLVELQQQARQTLLAITRELRQSDPANIIISNNGAKITFSIPDSTTNIAYYLSNDRIVREHPPNTVRIVTGNANNLSFCCWHEGICDSDCSASGLLEVSLGLNKTVREKALAFSLKQKLRLRNE